MKSSFPDVQLLKQLQLTISKQIIKNESTAKCSGFFFCAFVAVENTAEQDKQHKLYDMEMIM